MASALVRHCLLLLACLTGVYGMGELFGGVMHGSFLEITRGLTLLLLGGWWTSRELGRSMLRDRRKRPDLSRQG